jgi:hypothetical protein
MKLDHFELLCNCAIWKKFFADSVKTNRNSLPLLASQKRSSVVIQKVFFILQTLVSLLLFHYTVFLKRLQL